MYFFKKNIIICFAQKKKLALEMKHTPNALSIKITQLLYTLSTTSTN